MYTQPRFGRCALITIVSAALGAVGCGDSGSGNNGGTGGSVTITTPAIVEPNSQDPISDAQPTLTVTNVTVSSGAVPTYTFQVASDEGFQNIIAQQSGIGQGSTQTSWRVTVALEDGPYFWRARGEAEGTSGPFSPAGRMLIVAVGGPGETVLVFDRLTEGTTLASARGGGSLTSNGWRINNNGDFLRYEIPTVVDGYVQWENLGLTPRGANDASHMLMGMWDPSAGQFRQNPFRVHVQKLWNNPHNPPFFRFRWISQGREEEGTSNFTDWDPGTVYTFRVDWGPADGAHTARVFVNGIEFAQVRYNRPYQPNTHWVELGIEDRGESVIDAIYRNFAVVRRGQ